MHIKTGFSFYFKNKGGSKEEGLNITKNTLALIFGNIIFVCLFLKLLELKGSLLFSTAERSDNGHWECSEKL